MRMKEKMGNDVGIKYKYVKYDLDSFAEICGLTYTCVQLENGDWKVTVVLEDNVTRYELTTPVAALSISFMCEILSHEFDLAERLKLRKPQHA